MHVCLHLHVWSCPNGLLTTLSPSLIHTHTRTRTHPRARHTTWIGAALRYPGTQMTDMFLNQWRLHAHVCENFNPHKNGTEVAGKVWPDDCTASEGSAAHWSILMTLLCCIPVHLDSTPIATTPCWLYADTSPFIVRSLITSLMTLPGHKVLSLGCTRRHDFADRRRVLVVQHLCRASTGHRSTCAVLPTLRIAK